MPKRYPCILQIFNISIVMIMSLNLFKNYIGSSKLHAISKEWNWEEGEKSGLRSRLDTPPIFSKIESGKSLLGCQVCFG